MKVTAKFLIVFAVFFLAFTNRASADFNWGDKHSSSYGDHGNKGAYDGHGGYCDTGKGHNGNGGSGSFGHPGVAPEPVGFVLFLVGGCILALSYRQRKQVATA
jgi:hypothetical protein